jgi:hypothetical protein
MISLFLMFFVLQESLFKKVVSQNTPGGRSA